MVFQILSICNKSQECCVDLRLLNPTISRDGTNPVVVIPIPTDMKEELAGGAEAFDLKMMQDQISISFVLKDGPPTQPVYGQHRWDAKVPGGLDFTGWTNYEKLWWLFKIDRDKKKLYWGDPYSGFETIMFWVVILRLSTELQAGHSDYMARCQIVLVVTNKD